MIRDILDCGYTLWFIGKQQMPIHASRLVAGACAASLAASAVSAVSAASAESASDVLLIHGHIYTGNPAAPWAEALAINGTRIEAVDSDARILARRGARSRLLDLHHQTVIPGVVDSHMHMLYGAYALHGLNLSTPAESITPDKPDLLIARLRAYAADEWVSANLVKFFADGSTGLIPPLVYDPQDYVALVLALDQRGYQLMTHALRADSVHIVLDTYEHLEQTHGQRDRRLRIEHADLIDAADLPRFAQLGVIADMQPTFCCGEIGGNFDADQQIPSDRWHSLESSGATLAFSSDWPCTWPPDPFVSMQQTVTRQVWRSADTEHVAGGSMDGAAQGGARPTGALYVPEERVTVEQALRAYTQGSAFAAFADSQVGTLEVGKLADLAVLSQDIFAVEPESIGKTRVTMTLVGGNIVYTAP